MLSIQGVTTTTSIKLLSKMLSSLWYCFWPPCV